MAPPFVACRICHSVEGKLKNYKDSSFLIKAYEKLTGCPFVELIYLTKFCPRCACLIRKMYKFRKMCITRHLSLMDYLRTGRKVTKRFIEITRSTSKARPDNLSTWQTQNIETIDYTHNPKAYKSKKKSVVEGIINIKHVTVPKDPTAEIPIKPKPMYSSDSEFDYDYPVPYDSDDIDNSLICPDPGQLANVPTAGNTVETVVNALDAPMNVLDAPVNILEAPMNVLNALVNNLEAPMNVLDAPVNILEAPMNILDAPVNNLEAPVNILNAPVNILGAPVNVLDAPVNILDAPVNILAPMNVLETPVLCQPDLAVNEGKDIEVKMEDEMVVDVDMLDVTDEKSVKLEIEPDPDDMTLHEIKAEMLGATETGIHIESVEKGEKRKAGKKREKDCRVSKKSQRLQVQARRSKSNQELEEHFSITQFLTEDEQVQEFLKRREGEGYLEGKYKCELCLKSFKEQKWMDAHFKKHEPAAGSHVCNICKIRCRTPKLFRTHRDCNHTTRYTCRRCAFHTYSKAQALKHHGWHEGVEHTCQHCGATFRKHTTYMGHLRRAHPSAHICGACARSFVSAYGLNLHVKAVHKDTTNPGPDSARCEACDVTFVSRQMYIRHVLITDRHKDISKDILGCRKCGEQFDTKEEMERHTHYKERKYVRKDVPRRSIQCDQCSEVFSHPNGVYQHYLRAHPDTPYRFAVCRRYLCEQCGKTFKSPGLLQQHALSHLGLRPAPRQQPAPRTACRLCGKTYSKLSGLFRHKLTHMGVRRHKCHICEKAFTDTSNLKQHVQGVHLNIRRVRKR